jgi:hypothetical protein
MAQGGLFFAVFLGFIGFSEGVTGGPKQVGGSLRRRTGKLLAAYPPVRNRFKGLDTAPARRTRCGAAKRSKERAKHKWERQAQQVFSHEYIPKKSYSASNARRETFSPAHSVDYNV